MTCVWPVRDRLTETSTCRATSLALVVRFSAACSFTAATRAGGTRANIRVPSIRPGAIQLTVIEGASATARQRVRWMRPALDTARATLPPEKAGTPECPPCDLGLAASGEQVPPKSGERASKIRMQSSIHTSGVSPSRSATGIGSFQAALLIRTASVDKAVVSLIQVYEEGSTPFFLDLVAQLESFVAVAEMSHGDMHTSISEQPRSHRAKTATRTGNEGNAISQIHNDCLMWVANLPPKTSAA